MKTETTKKPESRDKVDALVRKMWVLKLEEGCWFAPWSGDPGRTVKEENAMTFASVRSAEIALINARSYREFPDASVDRVSNDQVEGRVPTEKKL